MQNNEGGVVVIEFLVNARVDIFWFKQLGNAEVK